MADPLEELKRRLYRKGESFEKRMQRPKLTPGLEKAPGFWKESDLMPKRKKTTFSRWAWVLTGLALVPVAMFLYFLGIFGRVESKNIGFEISAPQTLEGGKRISWDVSISNNNSKALENAELIFEYPRGAYRRG